MTIRLEEPLDYLQEDFLREKMNLLTPNEHIIDYRRAGEGNMNVVLRVLTNKRSFILKQSRPYVAKYPQVAAPFERISVEHEFYSRISDDTLLSTFTPKVYGFYEEHQVLVLEDLGLSTDFLPLYARENPLDASDGMTLVAFLKSLHRLRVSNFPTNEKMKVLNHTHIFDFPFQKHNGFDLDQIQPGLQEAANTYKSNQKLLEKIYRLGQIYLSTGKHLLHGDFYPGSWLRVGAAIKVIDMEFSFMGDREFDLGVMVAHLILSGVHMDSIHSYITAYDEADLDIALLYSYAGVELLRRLFGLAQLPLSITLQEKITLADQAATFIVDGNA